MPSTPPTLTDDQTDARGKAPAVAIVVSRYHAEVTDRLLEGAIGAYTRAGGDAQTLAIIDSPGSFELVVIASEAASSGLFEGVVALGCVVRGETDHDKHINSAVAMGLANASSATGVPIAFGLLTVGDISQALARAGGEKGDKGAEAMEATLDAASAIASIREAADAGDASALRSKIARRIGKLGGVTPVARGGSSEGTSR